jgi:hypothetical protein
MCCKGRDNKRRQAHRSASGLVFYACRPHSRRQADSALTAVASRATSSHVPTLSYLPAYRVSASPDSRSCCIEPPAYQLRGGGSDSETASKPRRARRRHRVSFCVQGTRYRFEVAPSRETKPLREPQVKGRVGWEMLREAIVCGWLQLEWGFLFLASDRMALDARG